MGKSALEGRTGITEVTSGWQGGSEVNRVRYDSEQVSVEQMEKWLKQSGTYIRTVEPARDANPSGSRSQ